MKLTLKGRYQDTIRGSNGRPPAQTPLRTNVVVYRALDLMAGLLQNRPDLGGILYWAVGSGDPAWDETPPDPDRRTPRLVNEIYRKPVDPARDITYDAGTRTLVVQVTFGAGEAVGVLREFGLFGGDASARPGSGYLINYAVHPAIHKTQPMVLERELRLTLSSDAVVGRALDLIAGLLRNRPGLQGIRYWAVGSGDPSWDETPPAEDREVTQLVDEIYRKPVDPTRDFTYDEDTRTLVARAVFSFDEAVGVLREFGLFGGDASSEPASGYLLNHQVHPAIDKTRPLVLEREFRLTLGADVVVEVPNLIGLTAAAARDTLEAANLALGAVFEVESEEEAGQVVAQDPPAGDLVAEGTAVDISVAVPIRVEVPDVRGLTPADAATVLNGAGLALSDETPPTEESPATPGTIIRQTPPAGTRVDPGTVVRVVLAMPVTTVVPDLSGLTAGEAAIVLRGANLSLAPAPYPVKERSQAYGTVVEQEPAAGERIPVKTAVTITLAAPWTVKVPDLTGLTPEAAADALRQAAAELLETLGRPPEPPGLALGAQTTVESEVIAGTIVGQTPAAGDRAPLYGTVDIELATPITAEVPKLIGLNEQEARTKLKDAGLVLGATRGRPDVARAGTVIQQEPRAGVRAARRSAVNVVLAEPIRVEVPDLIGRTLTYAEEVVVSRGLILGEPTQEVSDQPQGTIIRQEPPAGSTAALGDTVRVVIAITQTVEVPSVVGLKLEQARAALAEVGLQLAVSEERESDQPAGTVLEQQPTAGERVPPGSTVTVVVARVRTVEVPSVVGQSLEEARSVLAQVGLALAVGEERESDQPAGTVLEQKPATGERVPLGSTVTVVVARARARVVVGALDQEPDRLYLHGTSMLAAEHVLQALYDGPFDQRRFSYQPVILQEIPEPQARQVTVQAGQLVVVRGRIVRANQSTTVNQMGATFRLRRGLRWEDGTPVTAHDSVFSFELARHAATPISKLRIRRTASYEAVDDRTVVWTGLPGWADAAYVHNFWTPLPRHVLANVPPEEILGGEFSRRPVGYGPFRLEGWVEGERLVLERHPAYFRADEGLPRADRIDLRLLPDSNQLLELLLAGELDMALVGSLGLDQVPALREAAEAGRLKLHLEAGNAQEYLVFNIDQERTPFFTDPRVRQAIAFGIDRKRIVDQVLSGSTVVGDSFVPPDHPMHAGDLPQYDFDPERARAMLAEAGWPDGFQVTLLVPSGRDDRRQVAAIVRRNLAKLNIRAELKFMEPRELFAKGPDTPLFGRQFDLALVGWVAGVEPPAELFLCEEVSGEANGWGGPNIGGYCSKAFDGAALAAMSTPDPNERRAMWARPQRVFAQELPAVPLFQHVKLAATRPELAGFALDPSQPSEMWNVEEFA